jgi:hypothetical protein
MSLVPDSAVQQTPQTKNPARGRVSLETIVSLTTFSGCTG